jgi:hypothetical protein
MVKKKHSMQQKMVTVRAGFLSPYAFGNSLGFVSVICLFFYAVMTWFGGFSSAIISQQYPIYFSFSDWTLIVGLIEAYVLGYIGGWVLAKIYNRSLQSR